MNPDIAVPAGKRAYRPGQATLVALGAGTSLACVCLLGIAMIRDTVPGFWALGAIAAAFLACRLLAGVFGHLVATVPSGAGMFAFVARALGPAAGLMVIAPYVILMILLGALEALIVGALLAPWVALPRLVLAWAFLALSWLICVAGVRVGFRVQAFATAILVVGVAAGGAWILLQASGTAALWASLLTEPPSAAAFASATGQAIFLFMGFELLCTQVESSDATGISRALRSTVWLLAVVYGFAVLAASAIPPTGAGAQGIGTLLAHLGGNRQAAVVAPATIMLCLLAAITSLNGAFLGLSRLIAVMGSQRVLPVALAAVHAPSMIPRRATTLLLAATLASAAAIELFGIHQAVILAAAISAATMYAIALLIRERAPFRVAGARGSRGFRMARAAVLVLLAAVGAGVLAGAGESLAALAGLLGVTYGAALAAAVRFVRARESTRAPGAALGRSNPS